MKPGFFDLFETSPLGFGDKENNEQQTERAAGGVRPECESGANIGVVVQHRKCLSDDVAGTPNDEIGH